MKETMYKKVGRKYIPVNDPMAYEGLGAGDWIVHVRPGSTSIRTLVKPDLEGFQTASRVCEEKMLEVMHEASKARPTQELMPKQKEAWDNLNKAMGHDRAYLSYPSMHDIVQKGLKAVQDEYENQSL